MVSKKLVDIIKSNGAKATPFSFAFLDPTGYALIGLSIYALGIAGYSIYKQYRDNKGKYR